MSLFLVRSTLRRGWTTGLAIGAGIAAVDAVYCAIGAGAVLANHPLRVVLGLVGAAVLIVFGARTLWSAFRVRLGGEAAAEVATPRRAFLTSLAGTASNPLTIASWAAIFAACQCRGRRGHCRRRRAARHGRRDRQRDVGDSARLGRRSRAACGRPAGRADCGCGGGTGPGRLRRRPRVRRRPRQLARLNSARHCKEVPALKQQAEGGPAVFGSLNSAWHC